MSSIFSVELTEKPAQKMQLSLLKAIYKLISFLTIRITQKYNNNNQKKKNKSLVFFLTWSLVHLHDLAQK